MPDKKVAPYGSWESPLSAAEVASNAIHVDEVRVEGETIYWLEGRPEEGGRNVLMRLEPGGGPEVLTPEGFNVRTRVHEYGGGAYWLHAREIFFVNFSDQRLYRQRPGEEPRALTPAGVGLRYADGIVDAERERIICVREDHSRAGEPQNTLVALSIAGDERGGQVLVSGNDFYASPRLSPDGRQLAWLTWNHPNMPWDGTELWVAQLDEAGNFTEQRLVAGGPDISIFQPEWSPQGELHFISDRTGWWNLYRAGEEGHENLYPWQKEFGLPQWVLGMSTYDFTESGDIVALYHDEAGWHLGIFEYVGHNFAPLPVPHTYMSGLRAGPGFVVFEGASPKQLLGLVRVTLDNKEVELVRRCATLELDPDYISQPDAIKFPSGGETAYGYFYPPRNPRFEAPPGEKPPLLVFIHGGPTSNSPPALSAAIQFWTTRGFGVLDVNYRGSTGYGRAYRQRLRGEWGLVDVEDCINGARYLAEQGLVDGERLAIRGGSAGGFTTLAALAFHDLFRAGACYYGVSDLEALARETHKFESRYLDSLIGPYPERQDLYRERSPIHAAERLSDPVIFFQGLEDAVVPPNQSEMMVEALRQKGVPVAYVPFAGEQHGFRRAETIQTALESELAFYGRIFGFEPAGDIQTPEIENL